MIVYYSLNGATKKYADTLGKMIGESVHRLVENKTASMAIGALKAALGMSSKVKSIPHIEDGSLIYILSPIWASNFHPAIQYYLKNTDLSGKKIVLIFTCRTANKDTYNEKISKTINRRNCAVKEIFYFAIDPENPPGNDKIENDIKSVLSNI